MKRIFVIILTMLFSCTDNCNEETTNIVNRYQELIDKASGNKEMQGKLRDERDLKLANLKC